MSGVVLSGEIVDEVPPLDAQAARDLTEQIATGVGVVWQLVKQAYNGRAWVALGYRSWDEYANAEFGTTHIRLPREERAEVVASLRDAGLSIRAIASATGSSVGTVASDITSGVQNRTPEEDEPDEPNPFDEVCGGCDEIADRCTCEKFDAAARFPDVGHERPDDVEPRFKTSNPAKSVTGTDGKTYPAKKANQEAGIERPDPPPTDRRRPLPPIAERAGWDLRKAIERMEDVANDDRFSANKEKVAALWSGHLDNAIAVLTDLRGQLNNEPQEAR